MDPNIDGSFGPISPTLMRTDLPCETCGAIPSPETGRIRHIPGEQPSMDQIEEWVFDSICEATDGCIVEPDGICEHGHWSWLRALGLI
jgi:hypothetical protein